MAKVSLGRGLSALISDKKRFPSEQNNDAQVEIKKISANPFQPRQKFDDESLKELSLSIKEKGILQPLIVRESTNGNYDLIAGERRLRAAKSAGLSRVPVIIRKATDEDALELALIENIQRDNLNPMDEAFAYQRLSKDFKLTQEQIAQKVGKKRATIANTLRLLTLSEEIQDYLHAGHITMGHARALLSLSDDKKKADICLRIIAEGLSVRETERIVTDYLHPDGSTRKKSKRLRRDPQIANLEDQLQKALGAQVTIRSRGKKGRIEIYFYSLDEFDRISQHLGVK